MSEALRQQQLREEEQAVLADLAEYGELVRVLDYSFTPPLIAWQTPDRGRRETPRQHDYGTVDRLMHRGEVVLLRDDMRCQLTPPKKRGA